MTKLVVVESPAKARTIARILGSEWQVEASVGHVRDLPRKADELPAAVRSEPWARLGVDVERGFRPVYVVPKEKRTQVTRLRRLLHGADELWLATDEDREGEAIAWHLVEVLEPRIPVRRMTFHEISRPAIEDAVAHPRSIDERLVSAQEARRVLDRLVGWELSPVLWRKVAPGLSAGRVQSVAVRLVVDRERARMAFRTGAWWQVVGAFSSDEHPFTARLTEVDGERIARARDFDPSTGSVRESPGLRLLEESDALGLVDRLQGRPFAVADRNDKPWRRTPPAPFVTSTLQQDAARRLHFSAAQTMRVAQHLYERGYITYMRTDSTAITDNAVRLVRAEVRRRLGDGWLSARPRRHKPRGNHAQEAHEAIRPAGERLRAPESVRAELDRDEMSLYELVWARTLASQMADATGTARMLQLEAHSGAGEACTFEARGLEIAFPGFLRIYDTAPTTSSGRGKARRGGDGAGGDDAGGHDDAEASAPLPAVSPGDSVDCESLEAKGHTTSPPPRLTEAALVRELERRGIGRPSTFAPIIQTVVDRGYVRRVRRTLVPTWTAFAVVTLLERHFAHLVDYGFTASMETALDEIAAGARDREPWLEGFWRGDAEAGPPGLKSLVDDAHVAAIDPRSVSTVPLGSDADGEEIRVRVGRYGVLVERGTLEASVPDDLSPDELDTATAARILDEIGYEAGSGGDVRELGSHPKSGEPVLVKSGPYGPYVQLGNDPVRGPRGGRRPKAPPRVSVPKNWSAADLSLPDAVRLLSLPRVVGSIDGSEVIARLGRHGPFLAHADATRDLPDIEAAFDVTLDEAAAILAAPKKRSRRNGGRRRPPPDPKTSRTVPARRNRATSASGSRARGSQRAGHVLAELGTHPGGGGDVRILDGRYGPFVTDGSVSASVPKGKDPASLTLDEAVSLLARKASQKSERKTGQKSERKSGKGSRSSKKTRARSQGKPSRSTREDTRGKSGGDAD